jgi:hypothetical protein
MMPSSGVTKQLSFRGNSDHLIYTVVILYCKDRFFLLHAGLQMVKQVCGQIEFSIHQFHSSQVYL